jgi:hypothetical protein
MKRLFMHNALAEDFCEFGSSGRIYLRDEIVNVLQAEPPRSSRLLVSQSRS